MTRVDDGPAGHRHTPGPWKAVEGDYADGWRVVMDEAGPTIGEAVVCERIGGFADTDEEEAESEATARLIAAAPDLLAAADAAMRFYDALGDDHRPGECRVLDNLARAIARATGEA